MSLEARLDRIEQKIDRLDEKLDSAVTSSIESKAAVSWMKWALGGAWVAIAGTLFGGK